MLNKAILRKAIFSSVFGMPSEAVLAKVAEMTDEDIIAKLDAWKPKRIAVVSEKIKKLQAEETLLTDAIKAL